MNKNKPTTNLVNKKEFLSELYEFVKEYENTVNKVDVALTNDLYTTSEDSYHFITKLLQPDLTKENLSKNRTKNLIKTIFYKDIFKLETTSSRSCVVYMNFVRAFVEMMELNEEHFFDILSKQNTSKLIDNALERLKLLMSDSSEIFEERDMRFAIKDICNDDTLYNVCNEALKLAGIEGKIVVENSKQQNYTIELKEGYNFNVVPYKPFLEKGNMWSRKECKVLVVDGIIENVSELDQLLMKCHETKQPMAIISQGYSEEVVATLLTNKQRGLLDVVPLRLKPDLENLNVINDISAVCGRDPVSHLKGEMITFVRYEDLTTIDKITVFENKTSIENHKTYASVLEQVKMLIEKRSNNHGVEDIQVMIDNRIKSLSPNLVVIYLPENASARSDSIKVKIDEVLRFVKTSINYNVMNEQRFVDKIWFDNINQMFTSPTYIADISSMANNEVENLLFHVLYELPIKTKNSYWSTTGKYSVLSYYLGVALALKTLFVLINTNGFVKLDV